MMRGSDGVLEILNTLKSLILLDVKSLMGVLVWGDFALAALSFSYHKFHYTSGEKNQIMKFGFSKLMQSIAWLFSGEKITIAHMFILLSFVCMKKEMKIRWEM